MNLQIHLWAFKIGIVGSKPCVLYNPPRRAYCLILTSDTIRRSWAGKILSEVKARALEENKQVI